MKKYSYDFQIGKLWICEKRGKICAVSLLEQECADTVETPLIKTAAQQLKEYFAGIRKEFELPVLLEGTDFQNKVWHALTQIPYGRTATYKQIAQVTGNPDAQRAVGNANHNNKILIIVPCHRVIGSDGKLTGFAGGTDMKKFLLNLEKHYS